MQNTMRRRKINIFKCLMCDVTQVVGSRFGMEKEKKREFKYDLKNAEWK